MTPAQHTPTPLKVGETFVNYGDTMRRIDGPDGLLVALVSDRNLKDISLRDNDAAFIVRAVNSHEANETKIAALFEAAKRMHNLQIEKAPELHAAEVCGTCKIISEAIT